MKDFNGTVVIVDPEKIAKEEDLGKKIDLGLVRISPKLGFKSLFFSEVGLDRYFITFHKVDNAKEYFQSGSENYVKDSISKAWSGYIKPKFGQTSIDSGVVGVFLLDDLEKYNPGVLDGLRRGIDYVSFENFKGKIGYLRDKYGVIHFFGTGTSNFYTL